MNTPLRADPLERNVFGAACRALGRRWWLFAVVVVVVLSGAAVAIANAPRRYAAYVDVLLGDRAADAVRLKEFSTGGELHEEALADEVVFAQSDKVLQQISTTLGLASDPEFNRHLRPGAVERLTSELPEWLQAALPSAGADDARTVAADVNDALRKHLSVAPVGHSRVLRITAVSESPGKAAALANALSVAWRDAHTALQNAMNQESHQAIERRLADLRARADASADAVARYRAEHGLVRGAAGPAQQQLDEAVSGLALASSHLAEAVAAKDQANRALTQGNYAQLGSVLNSGNLARLQELEAAAHAQYAKLADQLGPSHPSVRSAEAQYASLHTRTDLERQRIAGRLVNDVRAAQEVRDAAARRLDDARKAVAQADRGEAGAGALERIATADQQLYEAFLARFKETGPDAELGIGNLQEIAPASVPVRPASPNIRVLAAIALMASLLAGALAVFATEARRRGLVSEEQVESLLGKPALGLLPQHRKEAIAARDAAGELLAKVGEPNHPGERVKVAITSAMPREGKTTAAVLMARAGARQGRRVLLIDGDLRLASLTRTLLNTRKGIPGLAELLQGQITPQAAIRALEREQFCFLAAGDLNGQPVDLLAGRAGFLGPDVTHDFDLVVIDTPPVLAGGDTALIAREADRTVFLARWGVTPPANATAALRKLDAGRVAVVGVALSRVNTRLNARYGHGESWAYSPRLSAYYRPGAAS